MLWHLHFLECQVKSGSNSKEINSRKSYHLILVKDSLCYLHNELKAGTRLGIKKTIKCSSVKAEKTFESAFKSRLHSAWPENLLGWHLLSLMGKAYYTEKTAEDTSPSQHPKGFSLIGFGFGFAQFKQPSLFSCCCNHCSGDGFATFHHLAQEIKQSGHWFTVPSLNSIQANCTPYVRFSEKEQAGPS